MPKYSYKARDTKGSLVEGTMDADEKAHVTARLQQMGYFPVAIRAGAAAKAVSPSAGGSSGGGLSKLIPKLGGAATATPKPTNGTPKAPVRSTRSQVNVPKMAGTRVSRTQVSKAALKPAEAPAEKAKTPQPTPASVKPAQPFLQRRAVKTADLASFNRQMADLLGAGIPLVKALMILGKQTTIPALKDIINDINSEVSGGETFADALAKHPREFSKLYVAMVRSGEAGGMLDEVLNRLADFSEQEEQLKGRIKSALAYPVVMICAGSIALFVIFSYVVPKIVGTFEELNQTLPAITQLLIDVSKFTQQYWYIVIGLAVAAVIAFVQGVRTPKGKMAWNTLQLRIPLLGDLIRKREIARFARTLGSLLKNGVSILSALAITRDVLENELVRMEVEKIQEEITQGAGVAEPLRNSAIFPPVTVNMMSVGEETGQLQTVLLRISDSYEIEVERKVRTMTSLIEPLIICVMGVIVGFIVIAMLLPIFSLDPTGGAG